MDVKIILKIHLSGFSMSTKSLFKSIGEDCMIILKTAGSEYN